ncbi:3-isopropylmalate dehydratase small subunit [Roseomonas sp. CCTCC AB2023176]|uniref:3-isopropylmalate dehydratase small subunit n=1 Tax=Roseomonas sp. CCTCC AB2023176 TaxID=3342640 RepID=UPI0035DC7E2D
MRPFTTLTAPAVPLPLAGVDTDQIIPARFMKRTRAEGYGDALLHDLRRDGSGAVRTDLALNDPTRAGARILVARRNFGGGSSREAAVYALADAGFDCVVAPSFGDIFSANAVNNFVLPARVEEGIAERLLALLEGGLRELTVDLEAREIAADAERFPFAVREDWRTKLLRGWDDLDLTLNEAEAIRTFAAGRAERYPWSVPG